VQSSQNDYQNFKDHVTCVGYFNGVFWVFQAHCELKNIPINLESGVVEIFYYLS
jgi:hypothetical protein